MRNLQERFENRIVVENKLIEYGFQKQKDSYSYQESLNESFILVLVLSEREKYSKIIATDLDEEYILVDVESANGSFILSVKQWYEEKIQDIITCCTVSVRECCQTDAVIHYIEEKYQDTLEYLWENSKENAVWRNKVNQKWYGVLLKIEESKLGIPSHKLIEIIDLKYQSEQIQNMIDNQYIFPGYHMNKKHWITIRLDGSFPDERLFSLIDNSYLLSQNKRN